MPRPPSWSASAAPRRSSAAELRARILPAATLAPEEKIVFDWRELDERARRMARAGSAHRLHQRRVRSPASRPHQGAGAGARGLRPAGGRAQQRRLGARLKGKDRPIQNEQARAEVLAGARSRRSRRRVRAGHAARTDPARAADRAGQGRRLPAATRWSAARWSRRRAARWCWSISCRASARRASCERSRGAQAALTLEIRSWPCIRRSRKKSSSSASSSARRDDRLFRRGRRQRSDRAARRPGISSRPAGPACWSSRSPISPRSW